MRQHLRLPSWPTVATITVLLSSQPAVARAAEPAAGESDFVAAVRIGVAFPAGEVIAERLLSELIGHENTVAIDLGFDLHRFFALMASGSLSVAYPRADFRFGCARAQCELVAGRVGLLGIVSLSPEDLSNPWFGLGVGYEQQHIAIHDRSGDLSLRLHGFEIPRLLAGLEWRIDRRAYLGPFLEGAVGMYTHQSTRTPRYERAAPISDRGAHGWITFGARSRLSP